MHKLFKSLVLLYLTIVIDQAAHDLVSPSVSTLTINDLAPVSIPAAGVNSAHELQVSASVSALAVAPVAHPEGKSPSPGAVMQANLGSIESEQNLSVSCLHNMFSAFAEDQQAQQSALGFFANAQNTLITGSTFNFGNVLPANTGEGRMKIPITQKPNSSPIFTGRKDVLDKLGKIFVHHATSRLMSRQLCLLWGLGGIGKTQICLKFIEEMSENFSHVFWVDASSQESMEMSLKGISSLSAAQHSVDIFSPRRMVDCV
ncbi:hypothetical protein BYT27DRAFT_7193934 [Phlegmacium glaucopus]|nr:hypothetical protein BYT27DRAFT_7193934 [Phlegmacium glaucopus]